MGSHSVTFHLTQVKLVNTLHLNPSQRPVLVLDLPTPKGRKAELT